MMLGAVEPRNNRTTTVTAMTTEPLGDVAIVVLIACGVVLRDFIIIDLCKVYYSICIHKVFTCASSNFLTTEFRKFWAVSKFAATSKVPFA